MAKRKAKELSSLQMALRELFYLGACDAYDFVLQVAQKYDMEPAFLEGHYFDAVARIEESDA
jgi:hypothetical protein